MTTIAGAELSRMVEARQRGVAWRKWGPYLSERQWGTVREDYSADGDAWTHFTHDQARSRAYHWGEDGLAGFSDDKPAGTSLGPGQCGPHPGAAQRLRVLRRRVPGGVPDRVGAADELVRGREGDLGPHRRDLPARRRRAPPRVRRQRTVPDRPALAGQPPLLRVLPRRQRGWHRREPPDRLDRGRSHSHAVLCRTDLRKLLERPRPSSPAGAPRVELR